MKNRMWIFAIVVFIALAVVFIFTDLPISQNVADPQSGWAHFMEAYGQLPGALVGIFGSSILFRLTKFGKTFKSIISLIGFSILSIFSGFLFWGDAMGQQIGADVNYILALILSVVLMIAIQIWFRKIPDEKMQKYKAFGQTAALLILLAGFLTVWAIKIPWGRWTFRDILDAGDLSLFTPWYLPQGNNGHHSFISGHTSLSFCVLPVVMLFKEDRKKFTIAWIFAILWGVVGAASRVKIGAHFASDVLFGAGQTLLWFNILSRKFTKRE